MSLSKAIPLDLSASLDLDLADRHRYGDETAFDEIYVRFSPLVYNLCLRMSSDPQRAQDLSQDVFLRVYKGLRRFRGRSSLKTWIYRIAVNHCRSRLGRRRLLTEWLDPRVEANLPCDPSEGPEARAVVCDEERSVAEALGKLPAPFREAVVLRDLQGLTYEEISEVLGVRVGTVRSRLFRGRQRLRGVLEGER